MRRFKIRNGIKLCGLREVKTESDVTKEHVKNNKEVRGILLKRGIEPENLPAEEDIKKIERKVKQEDKKLLTETKKLKGK